MKLSFYNITKEQSLILKAFAIIFITFHNFIHIRNPIGENEMQFEPQRIYHFLSFIAENPLSFLDAVFSYLGHYGVQLFIFLSAYGLTKQFITAEPSSYKSYIIPRIVKLYSLLFFGFFICFFINIKDLSFFMEIVKVNILMVKNLSYKYLFSGIGPWWYFSLALQFYVLFPFLFKVVQKYKERGLIISIVFSYILIYTLLPFTEKINFPMFGNFLGHLPEFLLGIGLAGMKNIRFSLITFLSAIVIFILSNFSSYFFPLSFLSVTIILLIFLYTIIIHMPESVKRAFIFIGKISMIIFIINGPLRGISYSIFLGKWSLNLFLASCMHFIGVSFLAYLLYLIYERAWGKIKNILLKYGYK